MKPFALKLGTGLLALLVLAACAARPPRTSAVPECHPPDTLTCDRFAGENYNCSCQRGAKLRDILEVY